jgi:hypothetical protein
MNFMHSLSNSFDSEGSFAENIKKKLNNSSLLNNMFQRKSSLGSVSRGHTPTNTTSNSSPVSASTKGARNLNGSELNESLNDSSLQSPSTNLQSYR